MLLPALSVPSETIKLWKCLAERKTAFQAQAYFEAMGGQWTSKQQLDLCFVSNVGKTRPGSNY